MSSDPPILGRIGRYELLDRLGAGGMGEVFLARATGTAGFEKRVVIKKILPHLADNEAFVRRFVDEGKLVVQLRHAGIAQVLDMGEEDGVIFLAMEYVDGRDLRDLMRHGRASDVPPPAEVAVGVLVRVLEALDHAHGMTDDQGHPLGIIHRDVSPSNVMVSRDGEVKLVDFGIARATDRLSTSVSGAVQGKFSYMSPQQAAGGDLDARSDQFSVGVLAWELWTGERPFEGRSDLETLDRIRHHDPGSLADACPEAPPEVVDAVDRMLAKDPAERYETAGDAARALQGYLYRVGEMVGAREIGAWVRDVLATLPEPLRDRPAPGLSLDDALRLSLDGGRATPSGDQPAAGAEGTVSVAASAPGSTPTPDRATPAAGFPMEHTPTGEAPADASRRRRRRSRLMVLLVAFNVLLLGAVAWLIWQADEGGPLKEPLPSETPSASAPGATPTATAGPSVAAAGEDSATGSGSSPQGEARGADASSAAPPDAHGPPLSEPGPWGERAGATLAGVRVPTPPPAPEQVAVTVRVSPPGATVAVAGLGAASSPRVVRLPRGEERAATARLAGYRPKHFRLQADRERTVRVRLEADERGRVRFRYFPANATVRLDGTRLPASNTNVVDREVSAGTHRLVLESPDGARREMTFRVRPGRTTNLATLNAVEAAAGDGEGSPR
ncbi:MAG: protein kinase domain-containing protein [Myxococcota bacterium]